MEFLLERLVTDAFYFKDRQNTNKKLDSKNMIMILKRTFHCFQHGE